MALQKYKALIVDDDRTSRMLTRAVLEDNNFAVDEIEEGIRALMSCKKNKYDIIFMDIEMPKADGYTTTKAIRGMDKGESKQTCIVALSGRLENKAQLEKCLEVGMNDCVSKPLKKEVLDKRLPRWLSNQRD